MSLINRLRHHLRKTKRYELGIERYVNNTTVGLTSGNELQIRPEGQGQGSRWDTMPTGIEYSRAQRGFAKRLVLPRENNSYGGYAILQMDESAEAKSTLLGHIHYKDAEAVLRYVNLGPFTRFSLSHEPKGRAPICVAESLVAVAPFYHPYDRYIESLEVREEFQNQGYGTVLLDVVEQLVSRYSRMTVIASALNAPIPFYLHRGYRVLFSKNRNGETVELKFAKVLHPTYNETSVIAELDRRFPPIADPLIADSPERREQKEQAI